LMIPFIVPDVELLDESMLYFRYGETIFQIHEDVFFYSNRSWEPTFRITNYSVY
jgi:hypothetical protein